MVAPAEVHATLRRHLLVDGFDLVLDTHASRGSVLIDARHLDVFSFFASSALGMNHPTLTEDADFLATLTEVAVNKPGAGPVRLRRVPARHRLLRRRPDPSPTACPRTTALTPAPTTRRKTCAATP